jgi:hypothetical protein
MKLAHEDSWFAVTGAQYIRAPENTHDVACASTIRSANASTAPDS